MFRALLVLLCVSAIGAAAAWEIQQQRVTARSQTFEMLIQIRNLREHIQAVYHRGVVAGVNGEAARVDLSGAVEEELLRLERGQATYPELAGLIDPLRSRITSLDNALQSTAVPGGVSAWLSTAEHIFDGLILDVSGLRDRLLARYDLSTREADRGAIVFQVAMLAVLLISLAGMVLGSTLVRRENRKRDAVEQALRGSEMRLELAERIAHVGYWANDRIAGTVSGSAEFFRLFGLEPQEFVPIETIFNCMHPDDVGDILRQHKEVETDARPRMLEYRIRVNGEIRHIVAHLTAETDAAGRIYRSFGTAQDVTEQRHARAEAQAWRSRFEAAIRAARLVAYERDPVSESIRWEGACEDVLKIPCEAIENLSGWKARIHPDDLPHFDEELRRSIASRGAFTLEYRLRRDDGDYAHVLDRSDMVPSGEGAHTAIGLIIDISDRKRMEGELLQAQKMESIGRLAGGVAHDLNNWLTAILGFAAMARIERDLPRLADHLDRIELAGHSAAKMTSQLLAFARRQVIEPRVCSLDEIARDAAVLLRPLLSENISLRIVPEPDLWKVRVDPGQFEQVIVNLAINARDAMPSGGHITIETRNVVLDDEYARSHPEVSPGEHVLLAISDTGSGIPPNQLPRIFEPFYTTKQRGTGTGLGLATVMGLVKQHKGHIWVYSELGKGTSFKIYVPRERSADLQPASGSAVAPSRSTGGEVVLVVEDEPLVRELAVASLRERGYDVLDAPTAEQALELLRSRPGRIHLLLTDVIMPGMSGKQIAQEAVRLRPGIGVLYTSGYTDNVVVHHGMLDEGIHFLQKPYTPGTLALKVREVLQQVAATTPISSRDGAP